jgi:hypothetical protein
MAATTEAQFGPLQSSLASRGLAFIMSTAAKDWRDIISHSKMKRSFRRSMNLTHWASWGVGGSHNSTGKTREQCDGGCELHFERKFGLFQRMMVKKMG